jgi:hypothetical protein
VRHAGDGEHSTETLTWIECSSGADGWVNVVPRGRPAALARFLRRYHDTVAGYRPSATSVWSSGQATCAPGEITGHGDFGPCNTVWRDGQIAGLIDGGTTPAPP